MLALLLGCASAPSDPWTEQVSPSGPCYAFNLGDGVVAGENTELHAAFACLNAQGTVDGLAPLDTALDAPTRTQNVGGNLVSLLSGLASAASGSLGGIVTAALGFVDDPEGTKALLGLAAEWTYAAHLEELGGAVPINSSTSLELGLVLPLWRTLAPLATSVLDDDLRPLSPLSSALRADDAPRWVWTLAALPSAPDASFSALAADWPGLLAEVIDRTEDSSNDRNPGDTGNSLRDGATLLAGGTVLVDVVGAARPILEDSFTVDELASWVDDEDHAGRWARLDDGLIYLASVDVEGGHLDEGEDSALLSLVRLLHHGNQPVTCSIPLVFTSLDVDLGNLSVALLSAIAAINPDTAASGVDVLGNALGYPLTDVVLSTVADTGVCPVIDDQLVSDLQSIDRLSDPASDDLLRSLLGLLGAADAHLDAVADVASALDSHALVPPVEELLLDLGGTAALREALAAVPALVSPDGRQDSTAFPAGIRPVDLAAVVTLVLAVDEAWSTVGPLVQLAVSQPSTWDMVHNSHHLLTRSGTGTSALLDRLAEAVAANPDVTVLGETADLLDNPDVARPALELVESPALYAAVTDTELTRPGPLPWLTNLYVGGTLDVVLDTLALFRPLLGGEDV